MKDRFELRQENKEHQKKEKKLYSIWKKIGILFGFQKNGYTELEEQEHIEGYNGGDVTTDNQEEKKEEVTTEPIQEPIQEKLETESNTNQNL